MIDETPEERLAQDISALNDSVSKSQPFQTLYRKQKHFLIVNLRMTF